MDVITRMERGRGLLELDSYRRLFLVVLKHSIRVEPLQPCCNRLGKKPESYPTDRPVFYVRVLDGRDFERGIMRN
jgi:hypothetical protein